MRRNAAFACLDIISTLKVMYVAVACAEPTALSAHQIQNVNIAIQDFT